MSYEEAGRSAGIPPGQVYLIVTGLAADGSDALDADALRQRDAFLLPTSQHLANPSTELPKHNPQVEQWIKQRARDDRQMRDAGTGRTAEPPPVKGADETDDVLSVLGWDHNQVRYLQEQLETIPGVRQGGSAAHQQRRVSIVDMIRVRLSQHESAEESYFWPAVRETLTDGAELADTATAQEQEGKDLLQALDGLPGDADQFDELVEKLVAALRKHVAFEETVFLRLEQEMPQAQREELGRRIRSRKPKAAKRPSRPAHRKGKPENPNQ